MDDATGEAAGAGLRLAFDRRLKLEFHGATVTSDAGLLAFRELDDALGLTEMAAEVLADTRTGRNGRHSGGAMLTRAGLLPPQAQGRRVPAARPNPAIRGPKLPRVPRRQGMRAVSGHQGSQIACKPAPEGTIHRPKGTSPPPSGKCGFKTFKYRPEFPERFGSIEDARAHCRIFFPWYNTEHRHSGIGLLTAHDVHYGLADRRIAV